MSFPAPSEKKNGKPDVRRSAPDGAKNHAGGRPAGPTSRSVDSAAPKRDGADDHGRGDAKRGEPKDQYRGGNMGGQKKKEKSDPLEKTLGVFVGDRVRVGGSSRTGEVMYVGRCGASAGGSGNMVGIRLYEKLRTSECDGKV